MKRWHGSSRQCHSVRLCEEFGVEGPQCAVAPNQHGAGAGAGMAEQKLLVCRISYLVGKAQRRRGHENEQHAHGMYIEEGIIIL
jgi:hypothetical protein